MPSSSDQLQLWGVSPESVDAYVLDGGPKELINWVLLAHLQMCVAVDQGGNILFARCSLHWCWERLHAWDDVVCYINNRYIPGMQVMV
jgi:hypothetical protein